MMILALMTAERFQLDSWNEYLITTEVWGTPRKRLRHMQMYIRKQTFEKSPITTRFLYYWIYTPKEQSVHGTFHILYS